MLPVVYALLFALALVLTTVFIHYEMLRSTWLAMPLAKLGNLRLRMMVLLLGIVLAHIIEISVYAVAYYFMDDHLGLGIIVGNTGALFDYFYFSATSFTTLGFGDLYPQGPIRIVVAIESLNGFVLIGWSTSYTYLAMQRFSRAARLAAAEAAKDVPRRG
jgi:hypothetical protein